MRKDVFIIILLLLITLFKLFDIFAEFQLDIPSWHIAQEAMLVLLTIAASIFLYVL